MSQNSALYPKQIQILRSVLDIVFSTSSFTVTILQILITSISTQEVGTSWTRSWRIPLFMCRPKDGLFAPLPDFGYQGSVQLWANYFGTAFKNPKLVLYIYERTFKAFPPKASMDPNEELSVPEGKKSVQVIRCALITSNMQKVKSDIATDFSEKLISCKKLGRDQMESGEFSFRPENETTLQTNPNRFQKFLQQKGGLCVSDLLAYLASNAQGRGLHENIQPIIQALDIILGHRAKLSLNTATPKRDKCFPSDQPTTQHFSSWVPQTPRVIYAAFELPQIALWSTVMPVSVPSTRQAQTVSMVFSICSFPAIINLWRNARDSNLIFEA